jgi:predicted nucleotidyltransferase
MSNSDLLLAVCKEIESLLDQLVLVGGCATELLITDTAAPEPRPTYDVDMVLHALNIGDYYKVETQLRELGFSQTEDEQGIICRWTKKALVLDVMPTDEKILGFTNRWYPHAVEYAENITIGGLKINYITAPIFIATKLEAFYSRGKDDILASHDLEDLISVIDGRNSIVDEIRSAPSEVTEYLVKSVRKLLDNSKLEDALPGYLPPDSAGQDRLDSLVAKLREISLIE